MESKAIVLRGNEDQSEDCFSSENKEIPPVKNNTKLKLIISIESTILILAIATTLLIGYFKFDWFKNDYIKLMQMSEEK